MAVRGELVLQALRALCPPRFALEGDKTGLQVGRSDKDVSRVLCTMDLTLDVAEEARAKGCELVVSHHAVIFRALKTLRTDTFKGQILEALIKNDVAVYVPHTAMDVVDGGMNDWLAAAVGLSGTRFLKETGRDRCELLIATCGQDGEAARALALEKGALSARLRDDRLEAVVPASKVSNVSRALTKTTGESPQTVALSSDATPRGIGRLGKLSAPEPLLAFAERLKATLGAPGVRVTAAGPDVQVKGVAVLGGDGRSFVESAIFAGADVLVTGDVDHHTALQARARGLSLVDVGHWGSEKQVVELLVNGLRDALAGEAVEVLASEVDTNPFVFV